MVKKKPLYWFLDRLTLALMLCNCVEKQNATQKPNIIVVFTDDQGYSDLGCYGSSNIKTPNIDKLASEGVRFTNFYVASSVCSASRAALLTGKLPKNNGVPGVFWPDEYGMDSTNITMAEVLKENNYRTACFGKWHLGDQDGSLPTHQGFDEYYGIPYSNDMCIGTTHKFADRVVYNDGYTLEKAIADQQLIKSDREAGNKPWELGRRNQVPIFENDKIVEYPAEQSSLTKRYFERAISFIEQSKGEPFFIYLTPAMPHVPLFASEAFKGKSEGGLYGDVVEEIDYYMGVLMTHLKVKGMDKNTIVIYASDNGPWLDKGAEGGNAGELRGGKFSNYEGGVRVPGIISYPGTIPENQVNNNIVSTMDLLPTLAAFTNSNISALNIDGQNIRTSLISQNSLENEHIYSNQSEMWGIRVGDWKYMPYSGKKGATKNDSTELYNLKQDIGEQNNLVESHKEQLKKMEQIFNKITK